MDSSLQGDAFLPNDFSSEFQFDCAFGFDGEFDFGFGGDFNFLSAQESGFGGGGRKGRNYQNGRGGNRYMCVHVFVAQKTLILAKKTHLTN
jgi:hypothetical protein